MQSDNKNFKNKSEPLGVWAYGMIPEKESLFLFDWSKIKEKHHVNTITWLVGNHTYDVTNMATQEREKHACMRKEQGSLCSWWLCGLARRSCMPGVGGWGGGRKPSSPKAPRVWIRHASRTQTCHWRNEKEKKKKQPEAARKHKTIQCPCLSGQEKVEDYGKHVGWRTSATQNDRGQVSLMP